MMRAVAVMALALVLAAEARGEFYRYKDADGAVVITDKLENVPKKYRSQLKVVWDRDLEAKDPLMRRRAADKGVGGEQRQQERGEAADARKQSSDGKRLVISVDETTGQVIRTME